MQADAMAADTLSRVVPLEDLHRLFNIESDAVVGHTEIHHAHSLDLYRRRHDVDQPAGRHPPFNGLNRVGEQVTQNLHHRRGNTKHRRLLPDACFDSDCDSPSDTERTSTRMNSSP